MNEKSGMRRQALVVGVEGAAGSPADESPPKWQPLEYAAPYAHRLREVLGNQYAYLLLEPYPDPSSTAAALGDALTNAVASDADFTIIHLLTHGELSRNGHGLQAVGGDGRLTETLARWVDMAENRSTDGKRVPPVLLILDLCHSGAVVNEHLRSLVRPEHRNVWVLAACHSDQAAYDGRLTLAIEGVLRGFASGALKLDASLQYIPIDRFCREVARSVEAQGVGSFPQTVERPLAALGDDLSHLRFFPNPRYDASSLRGSEGVDPTVFSVLDEVADSRHFVSRAHGAAYGSFGDNGIPSFTGRSDELRQLSGWLMGQGSPLRVVTGVPGVGKSALVGILACAAHSKLREATEQAWRPSAGDLPEAVEGLAVVHARRRTTAEVLSSLAAQWYLDAPVRGSVWTTDQLVAALHARAQPPYLIVDAVDEAEHPAELITALLMPLASTQRTDAKPLCRILIATRPEEAVRHLIGAAETRDGLIDLDRIPAERRRKDLITFVSRVLRPMGVGVSAWCSLPIAESLGCAMADTLLSGTRKWGEFLVAELYLRILREQKTAPTTIAEAEAVGRGVPRTLDTVLDLDLELLAQPGLHELLAALAWAEGSGMPEELLAHVAGISPPTKGKGASDSSELLQAARFYIRRSVDRDGTPLYRLFHQGLADRLRERPVLDAVTVWCRLHSTVRTSDTGKRSWATAEPYLLRHAARHSASAGKLDRLLVDAEFLVHADPAPLADVLYRGEPSSLGAVYLASYEAHHDQSPDQRRNVLAVDAARHQRWPLAAELSQDIGWGVRWTAGRELHPGLKATLTGHRGTISDLTTLAIRGRPHALTAGQDGTARLWDLDSTETTHVLDDHGSPVNCVVATEAGDRSLAVTGCHRGLLRGWDLTTGRCLWTTQGHQGPVRSMTVVPYDGVPAIASAGRDKVIRYWDPATGESLSTTELKGLSQPIYGDVSQLSTVTVGHVGVCVVVCYEEWLAVLTVHGEQLGDDDLLLEWAEWPTRACYIEFGHGLEPVSGDHQGTVWISEEILDEGHVDAITDLTFADLTGTVCVVSASADGTARLIEGGPPWRARQIASHPPKITRVAVVQDVQPPRLLTASDAGTVRIWDMTADPVQQRFVGHTHTITALLALPDGRLVSASDDGTLALWNTETGERGQTTLLFQADGHPLPDAATGIAVLEDGEHLRIVASCVREGFALWDTSVTQETLADRVDGSFSGTAAIFSVVIDGVPHIACAGVGIELFSNARVDYLAAWPHHNDVKDPERTPEEERTIGLPSNATCLAASATHIFAGYGSGAIWSAPLRNPSQGQESARHDAAVYAIAAVELDGQPHVISGDSVGGVRLTALGTAARTDLIGHTGAVLAVTPVLLDGRPHVLTGGRDRSMRLWDVATGRQIDAFWFPDTVFAITVAQDGTAFVGIGPDIICLAPDSRRFPLHPYTTPDQGHPII
ncbi:AAA family ATPase [Streptomyces sp. st140]|uniref:AAA family ATPase n=1 Tax=Streptomyces sp. st140 TaxID=1828052 RepID=UPI00117CB1AF|nr:AAA family ATPase [Streptomyces sp. st140]